MRYYAGGGGAFGRQWVGMDLWEMAYDKVASRLREYGILVDRPELDGAVNENGMMRFNEYRLTLIDNKDKGEEFPARTDDNEVASPALNLRRPRPSEPWQQLSNALIRRILVAAQGRNGWWGARVAGGRWRRISFIWIRSARSRRGVKTILLTGY